MKSIIVTVLVGIALCAALANAKGGDTAPAPPSIQWTDSFADATAQAQSSGKPVLLYLTADYCVYCKQMDKEAFVDSRAVLLSDLYTPCRVDGEHAGKPLVKKYDVKMYPYEAVVDVGGNVLTPASEYMDPDKYVKTLATALPPARLELLKSSTDATSIAQLVVVDAARGDIDGAEAAFAALPADGLTAIAAIATNHALGCALADAKLFDKAQPALSKAAAALGDCHEAVDVHFRLADCYQSLTRPADAIAELAAVRKMHAASKDEKKRAEKLQREIGGK